MRGATRRSAGLALAAVAMLCAVCSDPGAASAQTAATMSLTTYDDGRSCPAGCDAHVVFNAAHNGALNAFAPAPGDDPLATRRSPERAKCVIGEPCVMCFDDSDASCFIALYRGSGPKNGRFDATPAFMAERCDEDGLPAALAAACESHMAKARRLEKRVNCIREPARAECAAVMEEAERRRREDLPRYADCKRLGQSAYNAALRDPALRRAHDCAYLAVKHPNPAYDWLLLSPGACRDGYYVGRDGLDCCSGDPVQAAIDPNECSPFYPKP